jgi:hypothetical protein
LRNSLHFFFYQVPIPIANVGTTPFLIKSRTDRIQNSTQADKNTDRSYSKPDMLFKKIYLNQQLKVKFRSLIVLNDLSVKVKDRKIFKQSSQKPGLHKNLGIQDNR